MTDLLSDLETPSDAELISRVRGGDVAAYGDLFSRHVDSANRLARQLVRGPDSDDLVSEAFAKVLQVLQGGGGPDVAFRAYLLTAVRRLHIDRMRSGAKVQTSDDMADFDPGVPFTDTAVAQFESGAAAKAFATLPERWQLVLWHLEVEGQKPAEIATLLGMSANSVSALAYRAREGLRQAFLTMHLNDITENDCRWVNEHLGAYVRKGLSKRDSTKVQHHLDECRRCTAMYLELTEVNSNLRGIITPLLLGAAAAGYLSSTGSAGGIGLAAFLGRARDTVAANAGAATAGAVAAGVAAVATAGIVLLPTSSPERIVGADEPVVRTSPELSFPPSVSPGADPGAAAERPADTTGPTAATSPTPAAAAVEPAALLDDPGTTSGPATLPGEPGVLPAPLPGVNEPGPGAGPGTDPGTEPGTDPQPGPGSNPGTDPQPDPQPDPKPGPGTDPEPGPTGPGTEPGTDPQPGPGTDPTTPADPGGGDGDTSDDPGTGGDGGGQGGSELLVTRLRVPMGDVKLGADTVHFAVQGDPTLPATLTVSLDAGGSGIRFGDGGSCSASAEGTTVVCDTTPGGGAGFVPATADGGNNAFTVDLPLVIPEGVKSATLNISVLLPASYDESGNVALEPLHWTAPDSDTDPATADLSLSITTEMEGSPNADGTHSFAGTVSGIPLDVRTDDIMFTATAGVTDFAWTFGECTDDDSTQTCAVTFTMKDADGVLPTEVTIEVSAPSGYVEDESANNRAVITLGPSDSEPPAMPTIDVTPSWDSNGNSGSGTAAVTISAPDDVSMELTVVATGDELDYSALPTGCEIQTDGSILCSFTGGTEFSMGLSFVDTTGNEPREATVIFTVSVPGRAGTASDSVTLCRFCGDQSGGDGNAATSGIVTAARLEGESPG